MDIRQWLATMGLEGHADVFDENGVTVELLPELTNEDLKDLGVARLADRKRLLKEIAGLDDNGGNGAAAPAAAAGAKPPATNAPGERRQVTILFIDLAGFTNLSTQLDPEELHDLISRFYGVVDPIIEGYGGTVDKHLGDGIMALFGAPQAHGDDPYRAVCTAVDTHAAMATFSAEMGRSLKVHAGIACGEVVAGGVGRDGNQDYTVLGDSVNLASRLDSLADPDTTLICETTFKAVEHRVECQPLGTFKVKGIATEVPVWRAEALRARDADIVGGTFIGRRGELRQFGNVLDSCLQDGDGQTVLVRGEAGIGKSALSREFRRVAEDRGFRAHRALVLDFGAGKDQNALSQLLRGLLDAPADAGGNLDGSLDAAVASHTIDAGQRMFLYDLLGVAQPPDLRALFDATDETVRQQGRLDVIAAILTALAGAAPRLLIVEDIHWADPATLAYLAHASAASRRLPVVLVMSTRIDGDPIGAGWRNAVQGTPLMTFDLGSLPNDEALELVGDLARVPPEIAQRYIERAGGNPLFLAQLVLNAEESLSDAVPASIQSLVLARIDRLSSRAKDALQAASVLGQRFHLDALHHLIDDRDYDPAELIEHAFIRPDGPALLFNHALIQEGVYSSLLKRRRRVLHRVAADWFSETDLVLRADHMDRAEDPAAPAAYHAAAQQEFADYRYDHAIQLIERGLELAAEPADRFTLTALKGKVCHDRGEIAASLAAYQAALDLAQGDHDRCRAWIGLAAAHRMEDRYQDALDFLDKAEGVAERDDLTSERASIHHLRGNIYFPMGRIEDCAREHEKSLEHAATLDAPEAQANAMSGLADAHYMAGRMASAYRYFDDCVSLAHREGLGRIEVVNRSMIGFSRIYLNQFAEAFADAEESIAAAEGTGHQRAQILGNSLAAWVLVEKEGYDAAQPLGERAVALSRRLGAPRFEAQGLQCLGKIAVRRGERDRALEVLGRALAISAEVGHSFAGPRIVGQLALVSPDAVETRQHLADGEAMLAAGSVAHNHLYFYPDAIDAALALADWPEALRYCDALEDFAKAEPLPWCRFFAARGRALAAVGQGDRADAVVATLTDLRAEAERAGLTYARRAIDAALGRS